MTDVVRRFARRREQPERPRLSFGSWDDFDDRVVVVCHPQWRGIRTAAFSFRAPVVESSDLAPWANELAAAMAGRGAEVVVIHGLPPGVEELLRAAKGEALETRVVLHSSMAQHGTDGGEAEKVDQVLRLTEEGVIDRFGFVKEGMAEVFRTWGYAAYHVPNRVPVLPRLRPRDLGSGLHVGVFAEPDYWRKNVATQLGAVALLPDATAHVMRRPNVSYLERLRIVEHGELPWETFVQLQASVDLNLYVTLSECHPLSPIESYAAGVPCLTSRTSGVFKEDPRLWEITTVSEIDNPEIIAEAARRLLDHRDEVTSRAAEWMESFDRRAQQQWSDFIGLANP